MKVDWTDWKTVAIAGSAIVGLLVVLPKLGDGLAWLGRVTGTVDVAYAAKETAEDVQGEFHEYLTEQRAYTQALNQYTQQLQQQQMQMPNQSYRPQGIREWDDDQQTMWCCQLDDREQCFKDKQWYVCQ